MLKNIVNRILGFRKTRKITTHKPCWGGLGI